MNDRAPAREVGSGATIAIAVLGMADRALDGVVEVAMREAQDAGVDPLIIIDTFDFAPLRRRGLLFEQVIDVRRRRWTHPDYAWEAYRERQFELIGRKWRSLSLISFGGAPPKGCVEAYWRGAANPVRPDR